LKKKGYRIIATTPHTHSTLLDNFDLTKGKSAFFFGTELNGLSDEMLKNADEYLKIPMYGFTESFNISVSAALILSHLSSKLRDSGIDWELTNTEKKEIMLDWLKSSIKKADMLEKQFYNKTSE